MAACSQLARPGLLRWGTATIYLEQGNEHIKQGNLDQAITDYTRALEINPRYAVAYIGHGGLPTSKRPV